MKYGVSFMLYCVLTLLVLSHVREVESKQKRMCEFKKPFPGKCGKNGIFTCLNDFINLSNMPKNMRVGNFRCFDVPLSPDHMCKYFHEC
ncbi:Plant self-incompatibility response [Arabidopsis suecica]|uniref:Plant self-incompatibility response n=1 Tax=Arabidopsis suecica TaxID=45249 RepID=A0A8T1ZGS0_ARASU|nr:Plant self-incompatibility response [Arabidopsis suecica]